MDTLGTQVTAFVTTIVAGLTIGVLFDIYRILRGRIRPGHAMTTVMDILFWIIATPVVILQLVVANWLELRLYVLLGVSLGLFLYFSVFSPLLLALLLSGLEVVSAVGRSMVVGIRWLFSSPIGMLRRLGWRYRLARRLSLGHGWAPGSARWRTTLLGRAFRR